MKRSGLGRIFRSTSVNQNCLDTWYCSLISNALSGLDGSIRALGGVVEFAQRGVTRFQTSIPSLKNSRPPLR